MITGRWIATADATSIPLRSQKTDAAPLLPKGTIIKVTAWHDNTVAKKTNPDPNQWVGWGDRTVDEMAHAWINIVYLKDEDYKAEVEKRKTPTTQTQSPQQQH